MENLRTLAKAYPAEAKKALHSEALSIQKASMRRTPVETGALRASHQTTTVDKGFGGKIISTIKVGGPAAPYAPEVHYRVELFHKVGQPLFLQAAMDEVKSTLAKKIAERIKKAVEGKVKK